MSFYAQAPTYAFLLVRELAAAGAPIRVPVAVTCGVLGLSRQAYYQWCLPVVPTSGALPRSVSGAGTMRI